MKTILFLALIFVSNIGYSQKPVEETLIGAWILTSSKIVYPGICIPKRNSTVNTGKQFIFLKMNDFIFCSVDKQNTIKGTWEITSENIIVINLNNQVSEYQIHFIDSRLFLRNRMIELEFKNNTSNYNSSLARPKNLKEF